MAATLHVMYPITDETQFDYDYYGTTHFEIVNENMGPHLSSHSASRGLAGGPDVPPGHYAIYTAVADTMGDLQAALAAAGPVLADIPNYYNGTPQMLIGETLG
jgi:uncharacterized protein (TIGR02118 family)